MCGRHGDQHFLAGQFGDFQRVIVERLGGQAKVGLASVEKARP
jgi:hypothetical protein